jgi:hypothetical protein
LNGFFRRRRYGIARFGRSPGNAGEWRLGDDGQLGQLVEQRNT